MTPHAVVDQTRPHAPRRQRSGARPHADRAPRAGGPRPRRNSRAARSARRDPRPSTAPSRRPSRFPSPDVVGPGPIAELTGRLPRENALRASHRQVIIPLYISTRPDRLDFGRPQRRGRAVAYGAGRVGASDNAPVRFQKCLPRGRAPVADVLPLGSACSATSDSPPPPARRAGRISSRTPRPGIGPLPRDQLVRRPRSRRPIRCCGGTAGQA